MTAEDLVDPLLAEDRAGEAQQRPEVRRWLRRLGKLIKDMPEGLSVFVDGDVNVLALGSDGRSFMTKLGSRDEKALVAFFASGGRWDGGAW